MLHQKKSPSSCPPTAPRRRCGPTRSRTTRSIPCCWSTASDGRNRGHGARARHPHAAPSGEPRLRRQQKTCYTLALEEGADIVVMLHPDYQYEPRLITPMAGMIASGVYDVVLGSRILGKTALAGGMPRYKYVFQPHAHFFAQNMLLGKLSEFHTGYRAFSRHALATLPLRANSDRFRVRQPDAGAGGRRGTAHRRDLLPDEIFPGSEPDQLPPLAALRPRRARHEYGVPAVALEAGAAALPVRRAAVAARRRRARRRALTVRGQLRGVHAAWWVLFAAVLLAAAWLRAEQLATQVLIDDEWHALHKLLHADARDIATHFGLADQHPAHALLPVPVPARGLERMGDAPADAACRDCAGRRRAVAAAPAGERGDARRVGRAARDLAVHDLSQPHRARTR